jgi:hypothetical protein
MLPAVDHQRHPPRLARDELPILPLPLPPIQTHLTLPRDLAVDTFAKSLLARPLAVEFKFSYLHPRALTSSSRRSRVERESRFVIHYIHNLYR